MINLGTSQRPLRTAIVGSGPSGFYAAEELLAAQGIFVQVDMYDRLPTPYGLVRYGVAPDHPKIKNVTKIFEKTARHPSFQYMGNVMVGRDISLPELQMYYDAIIFSCGAQTDRRLGIPGEDLAGSHTATEFVAWYNGHPEYRDRKFDLSQEVAVVIGQGNVAMDVGRILAKSVDELKNTDIAQHALDVLAASKIRKVYVIGRRGPVQAAFTPPEIREFGELADCGPVVDPKDLEMNPESETELNDPNQLIHKKNFEILKQYALFPASSKNKQIIIQFFKSPKELKGNDKLEKVVLEKNTLTGPAGKQQAVGTGQVQELACGILFRSVGYRGIPIPGVPFDEKRGIFQNDGGRVTESGKAVPGLYAVGWIKRGPSGVIGTNKPDSLDTVQKLLTDLPNLKPCPKPDRPAVINFLKNKKIRLVNFQDWEKIDTAEIERGKTAGKPREKFVKVAEMLEILNKK